MAFNASTLIVARSHVANNKPTPHPAEATRNRSLDPKIYRARSHPRPHRRGRSRAQKRGQRMGRPSKLTAAQKAEARRRRAEGATRTRAQLPRGKEHYFAARSLDYHRPMTLRAAATYLFSVIVFIVLAMKTGLISANVRKLADRHGWDNLLIRGAEQLRWERIRGLWWLWSIFGLSGGLALALWLTPFLNLGLPNHSDEPPTNINDHDHGSLNFLTAGPPFAGRVVVEFLTFKKKSTK